MNSENIYRITFEEVQMVAQEKLGRGLSEHEIYLVEKGIDWYIDTYEAISTAIEAYIQNDR